MKCPACGADMAAIDRFCAACGTPRPRLAPAFENAAAQYAALRGRRDAGHLDAAAYDAALLGLAVQDEAGAFWMPGADSGEWHRYEGSQWVRREPPPAQAEGPPLPPRVTALPPAPAPSRAAVPAEQPSLSPTAAPAAGLSLIAALSLVLGWSAGWLVGYRLAVATGVFGAFFQPNARMVLNLAVAGVVSGLLVALCSRPGRRHTPAVTAALSGAVWALVWSVGWLAGWAVGVPISLELGSEVYEMASSLQPAPAGAALVWFAGIGPAGMVAGIVAGILAALLLPRPGQGSSVAARLVLLICWPVFWLAGWLGGGFVQAAAATALQMPAAGYLQAYSALGGACGGALLGGVVLLLFNRPGAPPASLRRI